MEDRTIAGRYRLTERIGSGGMGVVWRAEDTRLRRVVAVKELLSRSGFDQESVNRAVREGRIAARLQHANVIALYDVVEHDGHPWLVMEYLPSRSLATVMSERGRLPPDEVARLGAQLASGLAAAHTAGVVHRDVKPGNVLVTEFGTVKVTDFGTSRAADEVTVTASGMLVGTPAYLAPEVARGDKGGFPADVFALGATLYAAVEGEPPFGVDGNTIALLHKVAEGKFATPGHAGPLTPVLMRLLDPNPETRPSMADAERMLQDVRFDQPPNATAIMATPPVPAAPPAPVADEPPAPQPAEPRQADPQPVPPAPVPPPSAPTGERRGDRKALAVLAAVALIATVLVVYLLNRDGKDPGTAQPNATTTEAAQPTGDTGQAGTPEEQQPTTDSAQPETTTTTTAAAATTTTTTTTNAAPAPPVEVSADQALSAYYSLLPTDLQSAYGRLTDRFKSEWSPTFADYQGFWGQMNSVTVDGVRVEGPGQVSATVSYAKRSGENVTERHLYTMVQVNGQWVIDDQQSLA